MLLRQNAMVDGTDVAAVLWYATQRYARQWYARHSSLVHDHGALSGIARCSSWEQPIEAQTRSATSRALSRRVGSTMARVPCTHVGAMGLSQGLVTGR